MSRTIKGSIAGFGPVAALAATFWLAPAPALSAESDFSNCEADEALAIASQNTIANNLPEVIPPESPSNLGDCLIGGLFGGIGLNGIADIFGDINMQLCGGLKHAIEANTNVDETVEQVDDATDLENHLPEGFGEGSGFDASEEIKESNPGDEE